MQGCNILDLIIMTILSICVKKKKKKKKSNCDKWDPGEKYDFFCPQALNWKITLWYDEPLCQTYWFIPKRLVVTFSSRAKLALMLTVVHGRVITMGRLEVIVPRRNWIVSFEPFLGSKGWKVDNYTEPGRETSPARPLGLKSNRLLQFE